MATGDWSWGSLTLAEVRPGGFRLALGDSGGRDANVQEVLGPAAGYVVQLGPVKPTPVSGEFYLDGNSRSDVEAAIAAGVHHDLAGPDGETWPSMLLLSARGWFLVINTPGVRMVTLNWLQDGL